VCRRGHSVGSDDGQFDNADAVAVDAAGDIFATDLGNSRIEKFGPAPTLTKATTWGRLKRIYR
jgi:hypothetical protein